ncbi:MAG: hypothetical protein Q9M50_14240 [Methylococcales bacterium]|nr:hypothetical protein [Methylococcales bacterium]
MSIDEVKIRREAVRWILLLALNNTRPIGAYLELLLPIAQAVYPDFTVKELQRELGYLSERSLIKVDRQPCGRWHSELTHYGVDIAEYTIDCRPGIARPEKYW